MMNKDKIKELEERLAGLSPEEQKKEVAKIMETMSKEEKEQLFGQCPFCLIGEGKIDSNRIYEDDDFIAVLDINPATEGHALVFSRQHKGSIWDLKKEEFIGLFNVAYKITAALNFLSKDITICLQSGANSGQASPHLLLNIIPRYERDGVVLGWKGKKASKEELDKLAEKIAKNIPKEEPKITKIEAKELQEGKMEERLP